MPITLVKADGLTALLAAVETAHDEAVDAATEAAASETAAAASATTAGTAATTASTAATTATTQATAAATSAGQAADSEANGLQYAQDAAAFMRAAQAAAQTTGTGTHSVLSASGELEYVDNGHNYFVTVSGTYDLPDLSTADPTAADDASGERRVVIFNVWHDAASGNVALQGAAGVTVYNAFGATDVEAQMTSRGERRVCVYRAGHWLVTGHPDPGP